MKQYFVIYVFLVILFCKDCYGCFQTDSESERSVATDSTFYEECCCTEPNSTASDLVWLDPNNTVIGPGTDSNIYSEESGDGCLSLHIKSTSTSMNGAYRCVANYNEEVHKETHNLYVYEPLYFYNATAPTQYLIFGINSKLLCTANGASPPRYEWARGEDGQEKIYDSDKYELAPDGLIVKNVTREDAGIYKCTVSVMSTGEEYEKNISARVMTLPTITELTALSSDTVLVEDTLIIKCSADGFPFPEFIWRKVSDVEHDNTTKNVTWRQEHNAIIFDAVEVDDAGVYECQAKNNVGSISQTIEIKVLVPPKIISFPDRTETEGSEIIINCNATGLPKPTITITYEGQNLTEEHTSQYLQLIENLSILKVDRTKAGIYICNATNEVNFETQVMRLTVNHPPYFDNYKEIVWGWTGEEINFDCENEANPVADVKWKYYKLNDTSEANETDINEILNSFEQSRNISFRISEDFPPYGMYKCTAKNSLGQAIKNMELRKGNAPSEILNATVGQVFATSAIFTIETPTDFIGPDIVGFMAEYDIIDNYNITNIHRNRTWATGIPYKLESLKPNTTYLIRFAAINKVGTGEWTEKFDFITLEKSAPEPPIWLSDSLQPSSNNVLKWKEPEDNGEPIDYYKLRYCPILEDDIINDLQKVVCKEHRIEGATEIELTNLQYNTTYVFEIIAHNLEGDSAPANTTILVPALLEASESILSGGAIIGISVVIVLVCLLLLDVLLLIWRRQGIIASCCYKKNKKKPNPLHSRDKKGLLKDNGESTDDTLRRPNNGHREYEYNKTTGIITGKHSSV